MKVQPAVRKETVHIALGTAVCCILMILVFYLLHQKAPRAVPFDYRVIVSAVLGSAVAVANFFLMGLMVQKVTADHEQEQAMQRIRASYRFRTMLQLAWGVAALAAPCFQGAAGIIPLFFPGLLIKGMSILGFVQIEKKEET